MVNPGPSGSGPVRRFYPQPGPCHRDDHRSFFHVRRDECVGLDLRLLNFGAVTMSCGQRDLAKWARYLPDLLFTPDGALLRGMVIVAMVLFTVSRAPTGNTKAEYN